MSCKCESESAAHYCEHLREAFKSLYQHCKASIQATFKDFPIYNHHHNHDYNIPNHDYNNHNHNQDYNHPNHDNNYPTNEYHHPNHYGNDIHNHNHRSLPVPCVICVFVFVGGAANSGAGGGGGDIPGDSGGGGGGLPQATKTQISGITHGGPVSSPA
ncbi:histidine-rich glycoprotein-like isoform X2 [Eriocheir sinensis]|uniref:histidine-rich glycoprotein-like isoform X1 n=1 Tax=Eriocheir sinensis TaxID=95602 RepID=UPI0021C582A9|nr:histidine-rich glycoprotein-like isoform X1 [Eriocheir sinensis]XP_050721313.1 histidine-rich glycoprotein-like isoform X2 [Eriocheir sinensis]